MPFPRIAENEQSATPPTNTANQYRQPMRREPSSVPLRIERILSTQFCLPRGRQ